MPPGRSTLPARLAEATGRALARLDVLALFLLATLAAIWLGLSDMVVLTAFLLPTLLAFRAICLALGGAPTAAAGRGFVPHSGGLVGRDALLATLDRLAREPGDDGACILIQVDDWDRLVDRWGNETAEDLLSRCGDRLCAALRHHDLVARLGDARICVVLHSARPVRLATREAITDRLRAALGEPLAVGGTAIRLSASAGHTWLIRKQGDVAGATLSAAEAALAEALRHGPNAVRTYAPGLMHHRAEQTDLVDAVEAALDRGEIRAWFQPQICIRSGALSGFEALARWNHPARGVLCPAEFLPAVEEAGRMSALGQTILGQALDALRHWDRAGLDVPRVSVNFSATELRNPALADHARTELDRFDVAPDRLTVEILEKVAASSADAQVLATIAALRAQGISLDLDDFGVGQTSLSAIRRFGVTRIKIDRSFILGLDRDPDQQAMVAAILSMARHLGVGTLAEGVETQAVHRMLAQMGCDHMQGFHLARPMPLEDTLAWAAGQAASGLQPPMISLRAG